MELRKLDQQGFKLINKYNRSGFNISGEIIEGVILIFYDYAKRLDFNNQNKIKLTSLEPLFLAEPPIDLLIFGHPNGLEFLIQQELTDSIKLKNIKIEKMITSSACRTYNLLVGENRKVGCILFPEK